MPVLDIGGRKVSVDDNFLKMTSDQQNATVDEIASSFKPTEAAKPAEKKFGLEDTWPAKLAKSIYNAVTLPGDVYAGKVDPSSDEAIGRSFDLAGVVSPGSIANGTGKQIAQVAGLGKPAEAPIMAQPAGNGIVDAAQRISQVTPEPINVPRAFASDSIATQRAGQMARNVPIMGDAIPRATGQMVDELGNAVGSIASHYGEGAGPNVASRINRTVGTAAEQEALAARTAAQQGDAAVLGDWEAARANAGNAIQARETGALQQARQAVGDMSPQDMGQSLIARLRAGEAEARANKDRLYNIAGNSDASINADAVRGVHGRVANALNEDGRVIDGVLTPAANRMMTELENISSMNIPNRVGPGAPPAGDIAAVNMQGIEQTRKRLNSLSQAASNDADRSSARRIIREFDNWLGDSFDNALFSGSDEALNAFRSARAANTEWRARFGYNARDDADRVVNRIVTGEITPQEASNYIVGAGKVGSKGVSSRLLTRIAEATGDDPEAMQAIRGGVWNRLSQATEGADAKAGAKVANDIGEFLNGSGRDVANRLFTPEQRGIMRTYADTLRRGGEARETLAQISATTKPSPAAANIGPMQELASAVLGKSGKTDEALFNAIDSYARTGSRGDIHTLADLVRNIPAKDKGDLSGAIIRNMGQSKQTNSFSPDIFASEWSKYSPQAKAILFGNAGPHRQALDDIAMISQRYKDIGKRFGNPSGTAQNTTGAGAVTWIIASPYTAIPSLLTGAVFAKVLASPAGASSAAKWGKAFEAARAAPSPQRMIAFQIASRNLANTASSFGSNASGADFMRLIQSPSKAAADDNQPDIPGRVSQ
jgi:hypothetical protein